MINMTRTLCIMTRVQTEVPALELEALRTLRYFIFSLSAFQIEVVEKNVDSLDMM